MEAFVVILGSKIKHLLSNGLWKILNTLEEIQDKSRLLDIRQVQQKKRLTSSRRHICDVSGFKNESLLS